jgi:hypothetical protein
LHPTTNFFRKLFAAGNGKSPQTIDFTITGAKAQFYYAHYGTIKSRALLRRVPLRGFFSSLLALAQRNVAG